jgi:hypothetical protein
MSNQKYYWTTKDGRTVNVDDMTTEHLRNTLKMIIKNALKKGKIESHKFTQLKGDIARDSIESTFNEDTDWEDMEIFHGLNK